MDNEVCVLYSRGRPTSLVLLLSVEVAQLPLPLSGHPSLGLHHLFRVVGSSGGLVALRGVKVLEVRVRVASGIIELVHRVRSRTGSSSSSHASGCEVCVSRGRPRICPPSASRLTEVERLSGGTRTSRAHLGAARGWVLTSTAHSVRLPALGEILVCTINLCRPSSQCPYHI